MERKIRHLWFAGGMSIAILGVLLDFSPMILVGGALMGAMLNEARQ